MIFFFLTVSYLHKVSICIILSDSRGLVLIVAIILIAYKYFATKTKTIFQFLKNSIPC